tara:strand:+ start:9249 stop:10349 length:1101 start_codon:yes stop_codon:yes gene_type:complete
MSNKINLFDLKTQKNRISKKIDKRISAVLDHGQFIKGPEVAELEEKLAEYVGVKHCITCGNGTDAIMVALMALGVCPGDEILVPSFTYAASAEPISLLGAVPVFVNVDERTFNFDLDDAKQRITDKTVGMVVASLYGQCADYHSINQFSQNNNLFVLEDGAQSFGAKIDDKRSCSFTDIATTSFFPTKPLGCFGDGGAIFTDNDELGHLARQISTHGQEKKYEHVRLGVNSRLDTLQAAIILEKINIFDEEIDLRNSIASSYESLINNELITKPKIQNGHQSVYALYTLKTDNRDDLVKLLKERDIPTGIYYQIPLHKQKAFSDGVSKKLERTEILCGKVLSIPMHPYLKSADIDTIVNTLNEFKL